MQDRDLLPGEIARRRLQRGVAATVQHEFAVAAEKLGPVGAQCQIRRDTVFAMKIDGVLGVALDPAGLHERVFMGKAS